MGEANLNRQRDTLEQRIKNSPLDFTGTYLVVSDIHGLIKSRPSIGRCKTIALLKGVLTNSSFASQTQAFFLYREAAQSLVSLTVNSTRKPVHALALEALEGLVGTSQGPSQRAAVEALGSLPISVQGPNLGHRVIKRAPRLSWHQLAGHGGITHDRPPSVRGRSLVMKTNHENTILVVKIAREDNAVQSAYEEAKWLEYLCSERVLFPKRFDIPQPLKIHDSFLFKLCDMPPGIAKKIDAGANCHGLAFFAHKDYFTYPNGRRPETQLSHDQFQEVMSRCAWLFGKLSSLGIVHVSPIPLFHNRVQRDRREDGGLYEWQRGGRLDRWLFSCAYPNFGMTGVRDFEHLVSFSGPSSQLSYHMGAQLLSLLLTAGSYFRNKDVTRVGFDQQGNAVDARDLFDRPFLQKTVDGIFYNYYEGFTGRGLGEPPPFSLDHLIGRMIEEMGVDRHMEEVLRVVDQQTMSETVFREFLLSRGYPKSDADELKKGEQDIILHTGPHLGGFNERISLPELIAAVGAMSALCIAGKFRQQCDTSCHQNSEPFLEAAQAL